MSTDLRLAGAAIGCWLTALACLFCPARAGWAVGLGALALAAVWPRVAQRVAVRALRPTRWVVVAASLGVSCGAVATAARVGERDAEPLAGLAAGHRTVQVGLRVSDDPRLGRSTAGRAPTVIVPARLTWLRTADGATVELGARVLVLASDRGWLGLLPGQRVEATGRLSLPDGGDLRAAIVSVPDAPARVAPAPLVQRAAGSLRAGLQRACRPLPAEPGGLLPGLVVGDTSRLDQQFADDFRATGLTHLNSVSGANLAIVVGLALMIARWCWAGPKVAR